MFSGNLFRTVTAASSFLGARQQLKRKGLNTLNSRWELHSKVGLNTLNSSSTLTTNTRTAKDHKFTPKSNWKLYTTISTIGIVSLGFGFIYLCSDKPSPLTNNSSKASHKYDESEIKKIHSHTPTYNDQFPFSLCELEKCFRLGSSGFENKIIRMYTNDSVFAIDFESSIPYHVESKIINALKKHHIKYSLLFENKTLYIYKDPEDKFTKLVNIENNKIKRPRDWGEKLPITFKEFTKAFNLDPNEVDGSVELFYSERGPSDFDLYQVAIAFNTTIYSHKDPINYFSQDKGPYERDYEKTCFIKLRSRKKYSTPGFHKVQRILENNGMYAFYYCGYGDDVRDPDEHLIIYNDHYKKFINFVRSKN